MGKKKSRHQNPKAFLANDHSLSVKKRFKTPKRHQHEEELISSALSSKILKEALIQQKEIRYDAEEQDPYHMFFAEEPTDTAVYDEEDIDDFTGFSDSLSSYAINEEEINEEDEKLLDAFLVKGAASQCTLADRIVKKIKVKDVQVSFGRRRSPKLDRTIIDMYKRAGVFLSRYTSGKILQCVKQIPSLSTWEEALYLTEPDKWSANAMFQLTRIFASNLDVERATRFYKFVLLPRVREDIRKNKKLCFSMYSSVKKSLFKTAAFFRGILLPLCESGTCTLREAVIIGSIIGKVSIPATYSSAALEILAGMNYSGTTSYFIKLFLDKKYALPPRAINALVTHFMGFLSETRIMPVIWHQSLLSFVQRYKKVFAEEVQCNLRSLIVKQKHKLITPEILRELDSASDEKEDPMAIFLAASNRDVEDKFDFPEVPMEED